MIRLGTTSREDMEKRKWRFKVKNKGADRRRDSSGGCGQEQRLRQRRLCTISKFLDFSELHL